MVSISSEIAPEIREYWRASTTACCHSACCRGVTCAGARDTDCTGDNSHWSGPGTICNAPGNIHTPCCRADFNQSGGTSIDDIFMFINAWLAGCP